MGNIGEVGVDCTSLDGGGQGNDLRINGGDGGESVQLVIVSYE